MSKCRTCDGRGFLWKQRTIGGPDEAKPCPECANIIEQAMRWKSGALIWQISGVRGASPNETRRGNHWTSHKDRNRWRNLAASLGPVTAIAGPVEIIVREWSKPGARGRDIDNIAASVKWALDALVHRGYLAGDGPKVVRRLVAERPPPGRPEWCPGIGLEITIVPLRPCTTPTLSSSARTAIGSKKA